MISKDKLSIQLKDLALKIQTIINANKSLILSESLTFMNDKILEFEYTSEGARIGKRTKEYSNEVSYRFPEYIFDSIKDTLEFKAILKDADLSATLLNENSLCQFSEILGSTLLNKHGITEQNTNELVNIFLNDIYEQPLQLTASVEIGGIAVLSDEIDLNLEKIKITLRQAKITDFERKYIFSPYHDGSPLKIFNVFSAILYVKCCGTNIRAYDIQNEIDKIIVVLRLFKPASVDYTSYCLNAEAILLERKGLIGGRLSKNESIRVLKNCQITQENSTELVNYCKNIYEIIPEYIYETSKDVNANEVFCSSLQVAYRHYSDALLRNIGTEEKIMNAVIGLESLLLHENTDNTLRFWLRGAKILGFLNQSPKIVKHILKSAYNVRSSFVHGNTADLEKAMTKFNGENQDPVSSLVALLDCLRILIIAIIFLSTNEYFILMSKKGKKEFDKIKFLGIVDDSLIDKESENQLGELLQKCRV